MSMIRLLPRAGIRPVLPIVEVTVINKQKFLIELGRLLTFMSEEDRQEALTLYEKMFDDTDDEQALLQALLSPTRQAVIIARAYDANARKLQAHASANRKRAAHEEPEATPDFVLAILRVYEECVPEPVEKAEEEPVEEEPEEPAVSPDQFSLFADDGQPDAQSEEEPAAEEGEAEEEPTPLSPDEVDSFIADLSIEDDEFTAMDETRTLTPEPVEEAPAEPIAEPLEAPAAPEKAEDGTTVREPKVFLLIVFVLFAIPLTLIGIALLLIPTLLSLLLSAGCIVGGCAGIIAAFSGFPVFADILIVLGCAIIILALGLLFLWLFIWFVGGAIAGLVRSVIQLGRSWCYKEVAA